MAQTRKKIAIIYHTQSGHTGRLASAVTFGASEEEDCEVRKITASKATVADLLWCDGLLLGTPENFGYMSGALKDFFDRTFYAAEPFKLNKPYGIFISAGNDGTGAVREIERIAQGYPLKRVLPPLICKGETLSSHLDDAKTLGQTLAAGLVMGIF